MRPIQNETAVMVNTVTGQIPAGSLGRTLTHEHLLNDVSAAVMPGSRAGTEDLLNAPVDLSNRERLLTEPYSSYDNCTLDNKADALAELAAFARLGGSTVVDVTPAGLGRDPQALRELSEASGVNVIMGSGWYLEHFENALGTVDELATSLGAEFAHGVYGVDGADGVGGGIRPGVIGEIGVSADFTAGERRALRAACIVQREVGVPLFIHLPGWQRLGHEVLDIVLTEMQVDPAAVVLCHMDPSGEDSDYQRNMAERGVWLEFDMIGMPFTYPGEGRSPLVDATTAAIIRLAGQGHANRLLFSHDLFLKAMLSRHGGLGLGFVTGPFRESLNAAGVDADAILDTHPSQLFLHAALTTKANQK
jgi:phosphotriesterase-related protein